MMARPHERDAAGRALRGEGPGADVTRILSTAPSPPAQAPARAAHAAHAARAARAEPPGSRPTWAEVDLGAIQANVAALKAQAAAPGLMAVVKADGYGHGLVAAAGAALAGGADWLAVALVEEGQALRAAGVTAPVLVMTEPPPAAARELLSAGLTPAVYSPEFTTALDAVAAGGPPVGVHLKLDTGMRRVGVPQADWEDALRRVRTSANLQLEGLWSHFAVADEPDHPFVAEQAREFARGVDLAAHMGLRPLLRHLCNSAGTLHLHEHHWDMVRPGVALYGLEPSPGVARATPLRPAMAWYSRLALVKQLAAGEAVSYGLRWRAPRPTRLATVPVGYADGYTRALSNRGTVLVRGERLAVVGTVCMDQLMVDAAEVPVQAGDEAVLLGRQGTASVSADDWAALLGTINYEIVCGIGKRVPRVHLAASDGQG